MLHAEGLTPQARRMLAVLRERGGWMNRTDLAHAIHSGTLSHYRIKLLDSLIARGVVEVRRYRTATKAVAYEYRAKL
jgi:hypothetical protein